MVDGGLVLTTCALVWQTYRLVIATSELTKQQKKLDKRTKLEELVLLVWTIQEINTRESVIAVGQNRYKLKITGSLFL